MDSSNRLPVLAGEIRDADTRCKRSAEETAAAALDAGRLLIEAKDLVKHGEWGLWLQSHCQMAKRTARRYMQLARSGLDRPRVADLGIRGACKSIARRIARDAVIEEAVQPFFPDEPVVWEAPGSSMMPAVVDNVVSLDSQRTRSAMAPAPAARSAGDELSDYMMDVTRNPFPTENQFNSRFESIPIVIRSKNQIQNRFIFRNGNNEF